MKLIIFFFEKSKIFSKIFMETAFYGLDTELEPKSELELEPEVPQHLVYWVHIAYSEARDLKRLIILLLVARNLILAACNSGARCGGQTVLSA